MNKTWYVSFDYFSWINFSQVYNFMIFTQRLILFTNIYETSS